MRRKERERERGRQGRRKDGKTDLSKRFKNQYTLEEAMKSCFRLYVPIHMQEFRQANNGKCFLLKL